jgi:alkanesulfonate monooxygenase SsuD/methylene tetrahydromethanopterin reductase-like flavin-dependent oxidoreductase (luciferase family)
MLDLIVHGESLGFDVAWLAEIHFGAPFSLLSAPLMLVPAIAARTQRIRIGTAVSLLPLHHPLSLAEHAAMADLLSGGRLEFGVGRGSIPTQFHGFGVPVPKDAHGKSAIHSTTIDKVFAKWTDAGSLEYAFIASVGHLSDQKPLDLSVLHGDGTNTVAQKGGMALAIQAPNTRKVKKSWPS